VKHNETSDLDHLIDRLKHDPDVFARMKAARALAECMDIKAVLALIDALKYKGPISVGTTAWGIPVEFFADISETVASSLIQLASQLKDERAIDPLRIALQYEEPLVRRAVFFALCRLTAQTQNGRALDDLIKFQPKIDEEMSSFEAMQALLAVLEELKQSGQQELFVSALNSTNYQVLMFAVTTLLEMGKTRHIVEILRKREIPPYWFDEIVGKMKSVDAELTLFTLVEILREGNPNTRSNAARFLRWFCDKTVAVALSQSLKDSDASVRLASVESLAELGGQDVIEALILALTDEDKAVRRAAATGLDKKLTESSFTGKLWNTLSTLSDSTDRDKARLALRLMIKVGNTDQKRLVAEKLLADEDPIVRKDTIDILAENPTLASLISSKLDDVDETVIVRAVIALGKIANDDFIPLIKSAKSKVSKDFEWCFDDAILEIRKRSKEK
jgi:HEAT repeat protein